MTTAERNKHLREFANDIARQLGPVLGLRFIPKCTRITRRRGHGCSSWFTVPLWASKVTEYFIYYVAHEVCHALVSGHGPDFKAVEAKALAHFGLRPRYAKAGAGPYVSELFDTSGKSVCIAVQCGANPKGHQP